MDILPGEIYQTIFNLLPRETLLECTLVCHKWTQTAQKALHSHVSIQTTAKFTMFTKFMDHINLHPFRRNQVKDLDLFVPVPFNKRILCETFPNLESVKLIQFANTDPGSSNHYIPRGKLESTIKTLSEHGDDAFTFYLIESNLCDRLESLYLRYYLTNRSEYTRSILHRLENMPVLKFLRLELSDYIVTLDDIENLHQRIPTLEDFRFLLPKLTQNRMPVDIEPTSTIKRISWQFKCIDDSYYITDADLQYFRYIQLKYPRLEKLRLYISDNKNFESHNCKKIFEYGWLPLLRSMGPQLKKIEDINVPENVNIFKLLDDLGCKPETLDVCSNERMLTLDEFIESNQRHYVYGLSMDDMTFHLNGSLKQTKLVSLRLNSSVDDEATFVINHFLKLCPDTLQHLELESVIAGFDESDDFKFPSLITLDINNNSYDFLEKEVNEENILKCCPNLKKLRIEDFP